MLTEHSKLSGGAALVGSGKFGGAGLCLMLRRPVPFLRPIARIGAQHGPKG